MIDNSKKIVSVITINLNDKTGLQRTIESVRSQNNPFVEHIIIDGASTDGSVDLIKDNSSLFSFSVSEPDKGVYDAQNKGILNANGNYLLFLNSGDTFYSSDVISSFIEFLSCCSSNIIYGNSNIIKGNGSMEILIPGNLSLNFWYRGTLNHQSVFFRKEIFEKFGVYDISYKFSSDLDKLLNVYKKEPTSFTYFNKTICNYHEVGLSSKPENYETIISEKEQILRKYLTEEEYTNARSQYLHQQTLRTRMRIFISSKPWLKALVKKLYSK